jgi:tRNA-(ms[2]io[6]A)-hydroxylase
MLSLFSDTPSKWVEMVEKDIPTLLVDHAHCERKAAGTALNLMFAYPERVEMVPTLVEIVEDELEHYRAVLSILETRKILFKRIKPSSYGGRLKANVRSDEPDRLVDRLLISGLIEARSCERFKLLAQHLSDRKIAAFMGELFESEARHHTVYIQLAKGLVSEESIKDRLLALSKVEAEIIADPDGLIRIHS